jgi:hypothetical protein
LARTVGLKPGFRFGPCSFLPWRLLALAAEPKPPLRTVVGTLRVLRPLLLAPSTAADADARVIIPPVADSAPVQLRRRGALHRLSRASDGETCDGLLEVEAPSVATLHPAVLGHSLGNASTARTIRERQTLRATSLVEPTHHVERRGAQPIHTGRGWPRQARTRKPSELWPLATMDTTPQSATMVQAAKETLESTYGPFTHRETVRCSCSAARSASKLRDPQVVLAALLLRDHALLSRDRARVGAIMTRAPTQTQPLTGGWAVGGNTDELEGLGNVAVVHELSLLLDCGLDR